MNSNKKYILFQEEKMSAVQLVKKSGKGPIK